MPYKIKADTTCWTVTETKVTEKSTIPENNGKEREAPVGYYATLEQAATALLDRCTADRLDCPLDTPTILAAIESAQAEVVAVVRAIEGRRVD